MKRVISIAAVLCASTALLPVPAAAQTSDSWQFRAIIYGYIPWVDTKAMYTGSGGTSVSADTRVTPGQLIDHLKMAFTGAIEAQKGDWGAFTDVMYLNLGGLKSATRNLRFGDVHLPVDATASTSFDEKSTVWTLAGTYRVLTQPDASMDALLGARLLDAKLRLGYQLSGNIGPLPIPGRAGGADASGNYWDAIIGVKGHVGVSADRQWFVPYYLDVGTGNTKLTWQGIGGIGYAYSWGELTAVWRYLDYHGKSDAVIHSLSFSGPMLGVSFHW